METTHENQTQTAFGAALSYFIGQMKWGGASAFARKVGMSQGYISELASGKKEGKQEKREAIAEALGLPYELFTWMGKRILEGVDGEKAKTQALILVESMRNPDAPLMIWAEDIGTLGMGVRQSPTAEPQQQATATPPARAADDYISVRKAAAKLSAGGGFDVEEGFVGQYHFRAAWLNRICNPADAVLFDVVGDSMEPTIKDGETVLVDIGETREIRDGKIYALGVGDTALVKRLRRTPDGLVRIISDNRDAYPEGPPARLDEIRVLGRVIWHGGEL